MNKKRLSVVMAGAMLATSVAPVLAAETEVAFNNKATLRADILAKMATKKISNYAIFALTSNDFVGEKIQKEIQANIDGDTFSSAYGFKVTGKDGKVKVPTTYVASDVETKLADANLDAGDKVEVFERNTVSFKGQLLPGDEALEASSFSTEYVANDLKSADFDTSKTLKEISATDGFYNGGSRKNEFLIELNPVTTDGSVVTVKTTKDENVEAGTKYEFTLKEGSTKIDGRLPLDEKGNLLDVTNIKDVQNFKEFAPLTGWDKVDENVDKRVEKLVDTYTIGEEAADDTKETLKVSDLYDGVALTAKGTEILADYNNAKKAALDAGVAEGDLASKAAVRITKDDSAADSGIYRLKVTYYRNANTNTGEEKVITVVSNSESERDALFNLLTADSFKVGIVAGQNRYETAVNVAKQQSLAVAKNGSIVLVNGESLVDGLSAAPLAAEKNAPLLLAGTDKLPTATKEYIESKVYELSASDKKTVTVYLVGGKSVLSNSLVNEIEDMGLKVERVGGANREATSVAVANKLTTKTEAFVVGGNGEADAMSISSVAAKKKAPIIVSKVGGLSTDAVEFLRKESNNITIIGGESVVSKEEEDKINENIPGVKATRIAGKNRIETNNAIIKNYYKAGALEKAQGVVVVKDGIARDKDLVDALSAANYAAANDAAIVLATSKITDSQKSALLEVKNTAGNFDLLAQVGMGAERTVLDSLAKLLGISNF